MSQSKKTRSEQKREDILNAAMQTFRENGVQGTSMDELAQTANVSKRTVYNHFESKEALVLSLLNDMWEQFMMKSSFSYSTEKPIEEQLSFLIEAEANMICDSDFVTVARLAIGHFFYYPEKMKDQMNLMLAQETTLKKWLKAANADGKFVIENIDFAAEQIGSLLKGSLFWPIVMCEDEPPSKNLRQLVQDQALQMFMSRYAKT